MNDEDNDGQRVENEGDCGRGEDTIIRQRVDAAVLLPTDDISYPPRRDACRSIIELCGCQIVPWLPRGIPEEVPVASNINK